MRRDRAMPPIGGHTTKSPVVALITSIMQTEISPGLSSLYTQKQPSWQQTTTNRLNSERSHACDCVGR
jgi:hypothetical protein